MIPALLYKDILRRLRNPLALLLLVSMPLIFTLLFGMVFGGKKKENVLPKIVVLLTDQDSTFTSRLLTSAFSSNKASEFFAPRFVSETEGNQLMSDGKASALIIIHKGLEDSLLAEKNTSITLIKNPSQSFLPKIIEEMLSIFCLGGDRIFRVGAVPITTIKDMIGNNAEFSDVQIASLSIVFRHLIIKISDYLMPPLISLNERTADTGQKDRGNLDFAFLLSGLIVMSIFFMLEGFARDYFKEKENKTLFRILASPAGVKNFILSKQIFLHIIGLLIFYLVWGLSFIFFGVKISISQSLIFVVFSVLIISSLTGVISTFYSLVNTRAQGSAIAPALILTFSILGGGMIPLNQLPAFFQNIAFISPVYWGVDGLQKIFMENYSFQQLALHLTTLTLLALLFNAGSFILFTRKTHL